MNDCVFCKILSGAIPAKKWYEDDDVFAFFDIAPQAPVHFLVVPKKHITSLMEAEEGDTALLGKLLHTAQRLAKEQGCGERGGRFVINCKSDGLQSVDHLHVHVLGGRKLGWPPG
ncbi:MAG: histidine triad nucleotide-binding protein [Spirochaetaceae bacterium]|jgi:histidine triad (HIT) family protein|nr:histidine triad nucleotide-binding protein [Spirochaetaceae bacterium]